MSGAVRELVTSIKFKVDNSSLARAESAIRNLKRNLERLSSGNSTIDPFRNMQAGITRASAAVRHLRSQLNSLRSAGGEINIRSNITHGATAPTGSNAGLLNAIRNIRVAHADRVFVKGNISGNNNRQGGSPDGGSPRGGGGRGGNPRGGGGGAGFLGGALAAELGGFAPIAGVLAAGAGIKKTIVDYMDFDATMSKVKAVTRSTDSQMKELEETARRLGATTKFTAKESADAMVYLGMAGWKTEQIIAGMPGLLALAAASGEDLATTADIVSDDLTAFHMTADQAGHFADVLATASSSANTNVAMMGETFKYVGAVAGALGYSIEDSALAVGLMANAGIKASMAGTALRSIMTRLVKPPKMAADALNNLNFQLTDSEGNVKPFRQQMHELRKAFKNLTKAEQAEYAAKIAEQEGMSGFLALMTASDSEFNKLSGEIDNSKGAAEKMAKTMNDNLAGSLKTLGSAAAEAGLKIGKALEPAVRGIVDRMTKAIQKTDEYAETVKKLADFDMKNATPEQRQEFIKQSKEHPILYRMAQLEKSRRNAAKMRDRSQFSMDTMNPQEYLQLEKEDPQAGKMLKFLQQIDTWVGKIINGFGHLGTVIDEFFSGGFTGFDQFMPLLKTAFGFIDEGMKSLSSSWDILGEPVKEFIGLVGTVLVGAFILLFTVGTWVFKQLCLAAEFFAPFIKILLDAINWLIEHLLNLKQIGKDAFDTIASAVDTVSGAIGGAIKKAQDLITWLGEAIGLSGKAGSAAAGAGGSFGSTSNTTYNQYNTLNATPTQAATYTNSLSFMPQH